MEGVSPGVIFGLAVPGLRKGRCGWSLGVRIDSPVA